jgi:5'-AMP-activated protein kinase regulatory beta subunit
MTVIDMPPGRHTVRFVVDDQWKCSDNLPTASDADGNLVNYIEVSDESNVGDGLDELELMKPSVSPKGEYSQEIPKYLLKGNEHPKEAPPILPAQLNKVLLNSKTIQSQDAHILPLPSLSSLNHLYASSIRDGVLAVGTTTRYREKYVTTVFYKPVFS